MPNFFQISDLIAFIWLFDHFTAKNKDFTLKFGMMLFACSFIRYIPLFAEPQNFGFCHSLFKIEILCFGPKFEYRKSEMSFCRAFNFTSFGIFWLRFTSKLYILGALRFALFTQIAKPDVTKP